MRREFPVGPHDDGGTRFQGPGWTPIVGDPQGTLSLGEYPHAIAPPIATLYAPLTKVQVHALSCERTK